MSFPLPSSSPAEGFPCRSGCIFRVDALVCMEDDRGLDLSFGKLELVLEIPDGLGRVVDFGIGVEDIVSDAAESRNLFSLADNASL